MSYIGKQLCDGKGRLDQQTSPVCLASACVNEEIGRAELHDMIVLNLHCL
jgi:hypothetical protein